VLIPQFKGRAGYWAKINEAYMVGVGAVDRDATDVPYAVHADGGRLASQVVAQVLGLPIDYWVSLDFAGFRQFVDALGGVDVDVERAFTDSHYPANDDPRVNSGITTIHFDAGRQHMDGKHALIFARSRYSLEDGSDFGRARRQQRLLAALKDKMLRVETIPKVFALLSALEGHLHTSFSFSEVNDLTGWAQAQARAHRPITVRSGVIGTGNLLVSATSAQGAYILLPSSGIGRYTEIHRFVRTLLDGNAPTVTGSSGAAGVSPTPTVSARQPLARTATQGQTASEKLSRTSPSPTPGASSR
jgi:LCP family protein required for cell wall assembly